MSILGIPNPDRSPADEALFSHETFLQRIHELAEEAGLNIGSSTRRNEAQVIMTSKDTQDLQDLRTPVVVLIHTPRRFGNRQLVRFLSVVEHLRRRCRPSSSISYVEVYGLKELSQVPGDHLRSIGTLTISDTKDYAKVASALLKHPTNASLCSFSASPDWLFLDHVTVLSDVPPSRFRRLVSVVAATVHSVREYRDEEHKPRWDPHFDKW